MVPGCNAVMTAVLQGILETLLGNRPRLLTSHVGLEVMQLNQFYSILQILIN
jgi:hypothetical protein